MKPSITAVLLILMAGMLWAQETKVPIKFDGSVRTRSEADGRDFNKDSNINTYTFLRSRLGALVTPSKNVNVYIQIQDSRHWGSVNTVTNSANIDLHQGFFEAEYLWDIPLHFKAGRMEMSYGNERLIGALAWDNVGRSFDGFKLSYGKQNRIDLFSTILRESHTPVRGTATPGKVEGKDSEDKRFSGLYYKHRSKAGQTFDLFGLWEHDEQRTNDNKNLNRITLGAYGNGKLTNTLSYRTHLAYQAGKRVEQTVSAFMITASLMYTFQTSSKPSLALGFDYLSGQNSDDEDYKAFDNLFGTHHKFYGYMDYFLLMPVDTDGFGLQDLMLKFSWPFHSKWKLMADYHNFRTAKQNDESAIHSSNLGNEFDFTVLYSYTKAASLIYGLSFMVPGDLLKRRFGNEDIGVWSYLMLQVKF